MFGLKKKLYKQNPCSNRCKRDRRAGTARGKRHGVGSRRIRKSIRRFGSGVKLDRRGTPLPWHSSPGPKTPQKPSQGCYTRIRLKFKTIFSSLWKFKMAVQLEHFCNQISGPAAWKWLIYAAKSEITAFLGDVIEHYLGNITRFFFLWTREDHGMMTFSHYRLAALCLITTARRSDYVYETKGAQERWCSHLVGPSSSSSMHPNDGRCLVQWALLWGLF
jgi:hypothetical protein